eukprot:CAMPEP_0184666266 /NCGR_PEP_ID=MMETSP0308-20130426/60656_1 /TAXON_ID=38269 /ORGANISM="Gloeochaete witrockiana, Strain SAG 46.84" /LENGTH=632 /DNA_ID=CAMNT_0027110741 /DNA_START=75 /DNA_END=1970 /DNA_ORIENTATION=-
MREASCVPIRASRVEIIAHSARVANSSIEKACDRWCDRFIESSDSKTLQTLMKQLYALRPPDSQGSNVFDVLNDVSIPDQPPPAPGEQGGIKLDSSNLVLKLDAIRHYAINKGKLGEQEAVGKFGVIAQCASSGDLDAVDKYLAPLLSSLGGSSSANAERRYWRALETILMEESTDPELQQLLQATQGLVLQLLLRRVVVKAFNTHGARDLLEKELLGTARDEIMDSLLLAGEEGFERAYLIKDSGGRAPPPPGALKEGDLPPVSSCRAEVETVIRNAYTLLEPEIRDLLAQTGQSEVMSSGELRALLKEMGTALQGLMKSPSALAALDNATYLSSYDVATVLLPSLVQPLYVRFACTKAINAALSVGSFNPTAHSTSEIESLIDENATRVFSIVNGPRDTLSATLATSPVAFEAFLAVVLLSAKYNSHPYLTSLASELRQSAMDASAPVEIHLLHDLLYGAATMGELRSWTSLWKSDMTSYALALERELAERINNRDRIQRLDRLSAILEQHGFEDVTRATVPDIDFDHEQTDEQLRKALTLVERGAAMKKFWQSVLIRGTPAVWNVALLFMTPQVFSLEADLSHFMTIMVICQLCGAHALGNLLYEGVQRGHVPNCAAAMGILSAYGYLR